MFRDMRRKKQALSPEACRDVLERGTSGVLAVSGDNGYPYAVPLSYVFYDSALYFHCALAGHKLDALAANDKVSFCVMDADIVVPEEYTTYFRSVILFGRARVLEDETEKRSALEMLAAKYCPHQKEGSLREIERQGHRLHMVKVSIEHMTGKQAREWAEQKRP